MGKVEANLTDDTPNLGFISCPGGTRVKCKPGRDDIQEITEGQVLFFEVDSGLTREEQIEAPTKAGLPPALPARTGGKSVWSYYVLDTTYPVDDVIHGRKALSKAIEEHHPGVKTDHHVSPHQPARLAGGIHPKTGKRSTLINVTERRYRLDEILSRCPDLDQLPKGTKSESIWREPSPNDHVIEGTYPTPEELSVAVPLTVAIAKANVERINNGQQPGQGTGRPLRAYYLSRCLQAVMPNCRNSATTSTARPRSCSTPTAPTVRTSAWTALRTVVIGITPVTPTLEPVTRASLFSCRTSPTGPKPMVIGGGVRTGQNARRRPTALGHKDKATGRRILPRSLNARSLPATTRYTTWFGMKVRTHCAATCCCGGGPALGPEARD